MALAAAAAAVADDLDYNALKQLHTLLPLKKVWEEWVWVEMSAWVRACVRVSVCVCMCMCVLVLVRVC